MSLISTRVTLTPQLRRRRVDHVEQALVDLVAMRQQLVEVHRAHHRADVGHGEVEDGAVEVGDLVGRLGGIDDLVEGDAVDRDRGVVLGDDLLGRARRAPAPSCSSWRRCVSKNGTIRLRPGEVRCTGRSARPCSCSPAARSCTPGEQGDDRQHQEDDDEYVGAERKHCSPPVVRRTVPVRSRRGKSAKPRMPG